MARTGISYEQVEEVANELVAEGIQPTVRLIRGRLGTGSPNTIQRYLTAWFNARPQAMASDLQALTATSQTLKSECNDLVGQASQQTDNIAEQATCIERDQHAVESARIELATAQQKIEAQANKINELIQENHRLRAALEARGQEQQTEEQESTELSSRQNPAAMENQNPNRFTFLAESPSTTRTKKIADIANKKAIYLAAYDDYLAAIGFYD